jgi:hypothetical protein|tara:strand:+ start:6019 stop:6174 length:156 start_codon:yes stop_codon:yes gene_type:complete
MKNKTTHKQQVKKLEEEVTGFPSPMTRLTDIREDNFPVEIHHNNQHLIIKT